MAHGGNAGLGPVPRGAYLLKLVGLGNKLRTASTLALNRLFERDLSLVEDRPRR